MGTLLLIFLAKIAEVSLMTIRTVYITKGEKFYGSLIGFVEVSIWLEVVSVVLLNIQDHPSRMIVYALGFSCGNYIGCILEDKLAIGLLTINTITSGNDSLKLVEILRNKNIGVTTVNVEGINKDKKMLIIHVKRKRKKEVISIIENSKINAVTTINDIRRVYGGYGLKK